MSTHTPKPWYPGRALGNGQECIVGDGDTVVCYLPDKTTGCTLKREDAWLIAAAPDLLQACKRLIGDSRFMREEYSDMDEAVKQAQKAIAKATGDA